MAIQTQYVLVKKTNGDVELNQNSVSVFQSINSSAVVNTLVLKEGKVGILTDAPSACLEINNDGTGHALYIHQDGILAELKHAIYLYNNVTRTNANSQLFYVHEDDASSTQGVIKLINEATGYCLNIQQDGSGIALDIDNNSTNHGIYLHQDGVLASGKYALYVYSNAILVNSELVRFHQDNASSTLEVIKLLNDGTGSGLFIQQNGDTGAGGNYALGVVSYIAQNNNALVRFKQYVGSTQPIIFAENDGTGHGILLQQDGNLASGKYALYIDNNGTPADGAGRCIRLDGCTISSSKSPETDAEAGFIGVNIDGSQYAIPYYALS